MSNSFDVWLHLQWVQSSDAAREQFLLRATRVLAAYLDEPENRFPLCIGDAFILDELEHINAELYARVVTGIQAAQLFVGNWYATPEAGLASDTALHHNRLRAAQLALGMVQPSAPDVIVQAHPEDSRESLLNRLSHLLGKTDIKRVGIGVDSLRAFRVAYAALGDMELQPSTHTPPTPTKDYSARPRLYHAYKQAETLIFDGLPMLEALLIANDVVRGYPISAFLRRRILTAQAAPLLTGVTSDAMAHSVTQNMEALTATAHDALRDSARALMKTDESLSLVVLNPNDTTKTDAVMVRVEVPNDKAVVLVDAMGEAIPYTPAYSGHGWVTLHFVAEDVPPWGGRIYGIRFVQQHGEEGEVDDGDTLENALLSVAFDPHIGAITVFDKRTGNLYEGLNHYHDRGDCGTAERYEAPQQDTVIAVPTNSPLPCRRLTSAHAQTLETLSIYRVPEKLTDDGSARLPLTAQFVPISISTYYTLHQALAQVDIEIIVESTAKQHRLGAVFPLSASLDAVWLDGPEGLRQFTPEDDEMHTLRAKSFMTFGSGDTAISLLLHGNQSGVLRRHHEQWVMDLTLLRSTDWSRSGLGGFATPDAQNIGSFTFYATLIFHDSNAETAAVALYQSRRPLAGVVTRGQRQEPLEVESVVSAVEGLRILSTEPAITGEGVIVRAVLEADKGLLWLGFAAQEAVVLDARDNPKAPISIGEEGELHLTGSPGDVITVMVIP